MKVHITGYLSPISLFNGKVSCGDIFVRCYSYSKLNGYWPRKRKFTEHLLPKEIVESWEPVYKELFETGSWKLDM